MKVLLVGAGYVAESLAHLLLAEGHSVDGVRRSERPLPWGVRAISADVTRPLTLERLPEDFDFVVYGVAPGARTKEHYEAIYSTGVRNVLARTPKARFLLISSTAVYAESVEPLEETTLNLSTSDNAAFIRVGEEAVLSHAPGGIVLRASGIYGPGRTRTIESLLALPPEGTRRDELTNRIHRDDLARAIHHFLGRENLAGLFNASDSAPSTLGEVSDFLEQEPLPERLLRIREGRNLTRASVAEPPRTRTERSSKPIANRKLLGTGFELRYPSFREGYRMVFESERS